MVTMISWLIGNGHFRFGKKITLDIGWFFKMTKLFSKNYFSFLLTILISMMENLNKHSYFKNGNPHADLFNLPCPCRRLKCPWALTYWWFSNRWLFALDWKEFWSWLNTNAQWERTEYNAIKNTSWSKFPKANPFFFPENWKTQPCKEGCGIERKIQCLERKASLN